MPVLVRESGMLIAGHGRLEAAKLEGITEVPTIVARGWTEAQCQAYAICDNKLTDSSHWSEELLRLELGDLQAAGFDLALTGFDQDELDRLLVIDADGDGDPDEAPEPPAEPISKPGDLWICGEHRVLCGDARVLADVEKVLGGELADMCFTDPPYNVNYAASKQKIHDKKRPIMNDALGQVFGALLYDTCINILTVTKGAVYMCMSSSELDTLQHAFRQAGGKWTAYEREGDKGCHKVFCRPRAPSQPHPLPAVTMTLSTLAPWRDRRTTTGGAEEQDEAVVLRLA